MFGGVLDEPAAEEAVVEKFILAGDNKSVAARSPLNSFVGEIVAKECLKIFSGGCQTR